MRASPFELRDATPDDAAYLAAHLRESDRLEVSANSDDIEATIRRSIAASTICSVAQLDGRPVFVIGCAPCDRPGVGVPWLLGTDEVTPHGGALTRITKSYVRQFLETWPVLLNAVDERNVVSVRWLEAIGFTIGEPIPFGRKGERFHIFTRERAYV